MADKTLNVRQQQKYDTSTNWTSNNPILLAGEMGIESDTNKVKVGNGVNNWNDLPYFGNAEFKQVQADWNENDSTSNAYIKNKPTIPTKTSELKNDSNFVDDKALENKADKTNPIIEESITLMASAPIMKFQSTAGIGRVGTLGMDSEGNFTISNNLIVPDVTIS